MDIFGVVVIAFVTALGGGTIRDLTLGRFPIGWTQHPEYVYLVISAGLLTTAVASFIHNLKRVFLVPEAMGLIAFPDRKRTRLNSSHLRASRMQYADG